MKRNLSQQLGSRYVKEMYSGAYFRVEDNIYRLLDVTEAVLVCDKLPVHGPEELERVQIPADHLQDFASFSYPTLGYRQGNAGRLGNVVAYVTARRTALRGLRLDQLAVTTAPIYNALYPDDIYMLIPKTERVRGLFAPEFTPFSQGIGALVDGQTAGFAVSTNVAVVMSCSGNADRLGEVLFRGKVVGYITTAGDVQIVNKIMYRDSMKSLLTM